MLNGPIQALARTPLADLGAVRVQGPDAVRFLQGQLSNDVALLGPERSQLAGLHNPQGRVVALMRLIQVGAEDILAVLPRELAVPVAARLSKYVLRAKVKITDASDAWAFAGLHAAPEVLAGGRAASPEPGALPTETGAQLASDASFVVCIADSPPRWLIATPATEATPAPNPGERETWRALDIASGLPQVYTATSEAFVAQMLNADVLGAISFTKGCYTGQEVIARAHYRGRVKRRLQRFRTRAPASLTIGHSGTLGDGRSFRIVEAVQLADGRCEFLAVAPIGGRGDDGDDAAAPAAASALDVEQLSLPYSLPD